ncbi:CBS domain-containing protein [Marinobacterium arenosum]|uniref:CBS domain-containing protein n=1 Tax=Marinobacterium arenosum TaxID=2862496 RepID=UPI001C953BB9|nr:CBS domain-containing protein [Marinobacterium arenosum]MBY4676662.1 CBS domain-containing protein [Marinobacterium arenosum]
MLRSVKARDYMTESLVTFTPDTQLFTAIRLLQEHRISGAPVVDEQGRLAGILSELDCLRAILALTYHEEEMGGVVGDYMTRTVETVEHDADIIAVSKIFIERGRRRLPVVHHGRLVGQISRCDVLRAVEEFAQDG